MLRLAQANHHLHKWTKVSPALADSRWMPVSSGWAFLQIAVTSCLNAPASGGAPPRDPA
jgi:hypothetical protein